MYVHYPQVPPFWPQRQHLDSHPSRESGMTKNYVNVVEPEGDLQRHQLSTNERQSSFPMSSKENTWNRNLPPPPFPLYQPRLPLLRRHRSGRTSIFDTLNDESFLPTAVPGLAGALWADRVLFGGGIRATTGRHTSSAGPPPTVTPPPSTGHPVLMSNSTVGLHYLLAVSAFLEFC